MRLSSCSPLRRQAVHCWSRTRQRRRARSPTARTCGITARSRATSASAKLLRTAGAAPRAALQPFRMWLTSVALRRIGRPEARANAASSPATSGAAHTVRAGSTRPRATPIAAISPRPVPVLRAATAPRFHLSVQTALSLWMRRVPPPPCSVRRMKSKCRAAVASECTPRSSALRGLLHALWYALDDGLLHDPRG